MRYSGTRVNPYRGPRQGAATPRPRVRLGIILWALLLAPHVIFALVFVTAVVSQRLGWFYSEDVREMILSTAGALASGTVVALFMWPTAFLLERVLRRLSETRSGFRHLALGILTFGVWVQSALEILVALEVVPREHTALEIVKVVSGVFDLSAVPLFVVWAALAIWQRRR